MSIKNNATSANSRKGLYLVGLAFLFLIIILWHTILFTNRNYRQDEINTIHAAYTLDYSGIANWLSHEGTHPLGWRIFAVEYIRFLGMAPSVTRFISALFTVITLASIYQLGKTLFDRHLGVIAAVLFGFFKFTAWHTHELRPYAPLLALVTLLPLMYLNWLKKPTLRNAFCLFLVSALSMQVHFYAGMVMLSLFLFTVIYLKNRTRAYQLFGIFALVGLSFSWWLPAIYLGTFVTREKGIYYAFDNNLRAFFDMISITIGFPFLSAGLVLLATHKRYPELAQHERILNQAFRHHIYWRHWLLFSMSVGVFLIAWFSNYFVGTLSYRNLLVMMPFYCLTVAYAINYLPDIRLRYFMTAVVSIELMIISFTSFMKYYDNIPLEQMETYIDQSYDDDTAIVTEINMANRSSETVVYYLMDSPPYHPTTDQIYSIAEPEFMDQEFFFYTVDRSVNKSDQIDAQSLEEFETFLLDFKRVWYIEFTGPSPKRGRPTGDAYRAILDEHFMLVDHRIFKSDELLEFDVQEYIRK